MEYEEMIGSSTEQRDHGHRLHPLPLPVNYRDPSFSYHPYRGHHVIGMQTPSPFSITPSPMTDGGFFRRFPELGATGQNQWLWEELRLLDSLLDNPTAVGWDEADLVLQNNPGSSDPYGVWDGRGNVVMRGASDDSVAVVPLNYFSPYQERSAPLELQPHCRLGASMLQPCSVSRQEDTLLSHPRDPCSNSFSFPPSDANMSSDLQIYRDSVFERNNHCDSILSTNRASAIQCLRTSQLRDVNSRGEWDEVLSPASSETVLSRQHSGLQTLNWQRGASFNGYIPQSPSSERNARGIKAFPCEDSFIMQRKELPHVVRDGCEFPRGRKKSQRRGWLDSRGSPVLYGHNFHSPGAYPLKCDSLVDFAKDQNGCEVLQHKFDVGTLKEREFIFREIINHVAELMMDPFGNSLVEKVLKVCTKEQITEIILMLTEDPRVLVSISMNTHGSRAVQKLIEMLTAREQTALVIQALQLGFLSLTKDEHAYHVIQRCVECFCYEDKKFIFYAAAKHCIDIATNSRGCCVLKCCIANSNGELQARLIAEVTMNGLLLSQDPFGNYVVQDILTLKIPWAIANLVVQFKGNYVHLSMQKFSSHVVQKCLTMFKEEGRIGIINELVSMPHFEQLMQDPYANYVIQSALKVSKGYIYNRLVGAILNHIEILKTSPYCKPFRNRILSLLR